tara:strand:- start:36 stop:500 length:465 start_codon:yes stop_codon:yes gene_type:complete
MENLKPKTHRLCRENYDPEETYYMVTYHDHEVGEYVRIPFIPSKDLVSKLAVITLGLKQGMLSNLQIFTEDFLSTPYLNQDFYKSDELQTHIANHLETASTREVLFDKRYESFALRFTKGKEARDKWEADFEERRKRIEASYNALPADKQKEYC